MISGKLDTTEGPIKPLSPVNTFTAVIKKGGTYYFNIPLTHNAFVYLLDGKLKINNTQDVLAHHAIIFNVDGAGFNLEALEDTRVFIGTGEPLNEPLATHGPFVMNTETEIMEEFRDYQLGKMGILIED